MRKVGLMMIMVVAFACVTNGYSQLARNVRPGAVADTVYNLPYQYKFNECKIAHGSDQCVISNEEEYQKLLRGPSQNIDWGKHTLVGMYWDASSQDKVIGWIDYIACHKKGENCQNHYLVQVAIYNDGEAMGMKLFMDWYLIPRLSETETVKFRSKTYYVKDIYGFEKK